MLIPTVIALTLPATAAVIYVSMRPLWAMGGGADNGDVARTYRGIALRVVGFLLTLQLLIVLSVTGASWLLPIAPRAVVVLFGLFLATIGDALPRTRPNLLFGIRTARTLDDRVLWIRLHRLGGYLAVSGGAAIALSGLFLSRDGIAWVVSSVGLIACVTLAGAYVRSFPITEWTPAGRQRCARHIAVWVLRLLLAVLFFYAGITKFPGDPRGMWVRLFDQIGFGQWFRIVTGLVEMAGAILLLTPRGFLPGAAVLIAAMIGALLAHVFVIGVGTHTLVVAILLASLVVTSVASRAQ